MNLKRTVQILARTGKSQHVMIFVLGHTGNRPISLSYILPPRGHARTLIAAASI